MNRKPRLDDIDSAKGLAIFLVVLGHISGGGGAAGFPTHSDWYGVINRACYQFHMSFFMFLSGFVFFYTYKPVPSMRQYGRFVIRRFSRFAPAYLVFGGLMIAGKVVGQHFVHVDAPPESFWQGFLQILIRPSNSQAATLWYIYALLVFQVLFPICLWLARDRIVWLLPLAFLLHFVNGTTLFCLDRACELAFVFLVGACAASYCPAWMAFIDRFRNLFLAAFLIVLVAAAIDRSFPKYPVALLSVPALHGLCRRPAWRTSYWLLLLGKYTLVIYLMNTMVIGLEKSLLLKFHLWNGWQFILFAPVLVLSGVFVPIFLKANIFRRIPPLDRITT